MSQNSLKYYLLTSPVYQSLVKAFQNLPLHFLLFCALKFLFHKLAQYERLSGWWWFKLYNIILETIKKDLPVAVYCYPTV